MGTGIRGGGAARQLQAVLDAGAIGSMGDGELLGRFLGRDDSAGPAFAALVDRHGRMVLRVCRDVLGDRHDAQDAAQATFFILARKAAAIRKPEALPSWLHGTARRVASRALRESIRRRRHERRDAKSAMNEPGDEPRRDWPELHEELARLPDRYREPIVLCDLAGLTHEQAAGKLGCPPRTLETRLYRGRERLKDRLVRRGLAPSAALVGIPWAAESPAALPPIWAASTTWAAVQLAKGGGWASVGDVPVNAARWARDHLKETAMFKLKLILGSGLLLGLAWQQVKSQTLPPKDSARVAAAPKAPQAAPQSFVDPDRPTVYGWPVSVSGRAFDPEGKPLAGARVSIASRKGEYRRIGGSTTDAEGRYAFSMPLPIERSDTVNGRDHGEFQVLGEAKGFGFAFRPVKNFYPYPNSSNILYVPDPRDPPSRYEASDKIVIDLKFRPPAHLAGTIVDDRGNPLPGVDLEIRDCETGVSLDDNSLWTFDALNEHDSVSASMKLRTSDALGRFDFDDLPADCRYRIIANLKGFPSQTILAATALVSERHFLGSPVQTGELKVVMPIPMDISIKMIYADTSMPAPKVAVQAGGGDVMILETSDDQGLATLKLPKGNYRMSNWPARGTPYLVTEARLEVGQESPASPVVFTLRRAGELEVTVVDESTGEGLADVDLWHENEGQREKYVMESWEVATRIARRDSPRSDSKGKLRVFVEPGKHRFGVGLEAYPRGYVAVDPKGREVECRAGETSTLKFAMRSRH